MTGFAHNPLDRHSERRDDAAFIASLRGRTDARVVLLAEDIPLLRKGAPLDALFAPDAAAGIGEFGAHAYLGTGPRGPLFAATVLHPVADIRARHADIIGIDLRSLVVQGAVEPDVLGALGQAKSLFYWHARHRFCGNCGQETRVTASGWRRECDACKAQHFPRTDPVAIMLAHDGGHCLLGRQARFPPGVYSCLAGFIEPGETIEDAVRREIAEEAGIRTREVRYVAAQPGPFPASLMIGCLARAVNRDITIDVAELEDARWFSRAECKLILAGKHPARVTSPPPMAIAHHLLKAWAMDGLEA